MQFYELFGIPKPVDTFLESLPLSVKWQKEGASDYAILFAETKGCHIEIWLDTVKDSAVKRFLFHSEKDNGLSSGVKKYVYEVNEYGTKEEFYFPRKITIEMSLYEREVLAQIPGQDNEPKKVKLPSKASKKKSVFLMSKSIPD